MSSLCLVEGAAAACAAPASLECHIRWLTGAVVQAQVLERTAPGGLHDGDIYSTRAAFGDF